MIIGECPTAQAARYVPDLDAIEIVTTQVGALGYCR
jgi:hypothetical protein